MQTYKWRKRECWPNRFCRQKERVAESSFPWDGAGIKKTNDSALIKLTRSHIEAIKICNGNETIDDSSGDSMLSTRVLNPPLMQSHHKILIPYSDIIYVTTFFEERYYLKMSRYFNIFCKQCRVNNKNKA